MPIKTLHITNCFHPSSGGVRTFYRALLEAANQHRREVRLIVPGPADSVEEVGAFGRIYTIAAPRSPIFDSRYRILLPYLYALPVRSALRRIIRKEQPNLVEVCDKHSLCFLPSILRRGWIGGVRPAAVVGLSCERFDDNFSAYFSPGRLGRRFAAWYMKTVYAPRFDCHIANSEYTAEELRQVLTERADIMVRVCPMGVDCEDFSPQRRSESKRQALLDRFPRPADPEKPARLLLYAGRISPEKNVSLLLDVMESLCRDPSEDYRLLIAGAGIQAGWLEREGGRRVSGRLRLLGHVSDGERLADIYANCDALIHPNPREPFGIAPLEAMASGLPVVAPRAGGVLSYAGEANSWLADPGGPAFAAAVRHVFADERARKEKIERAIQTAASFAWPRAAARFFRLYDEVHEKLCEPRSEDARPHEDEPILLPA